MRHIPRFYFEHLNESITLNDSQSYHLVRVLRFKEGDECLLFNPIDGEFLYKAEKITKKNVQVKKVQKIKSFTISRKIAIAFCIIKPTNTKLIIEKCTELGVTDFFPIKSQYTNNKVDTKKLKLIAISASEQCGRLDIPNIYETQPLDMFIKSLPSNFVWLSAIERLENQKELELHTGNTGIIIGPEGGFSEPEKQLLLENTKQIFLSNNILRSETAAISAISRVQ